MTEEFLIELFAGSFSNKDISSICLKNLKFSYLPTEEHKMIWKAIKNFHDIEGKMPTVGTIAQRLDNSTDEGNKCIDILAKVSSRAYDKSQLLSSFEKYVKESMSVEFFNRFVDEMNSGNSEKAHDLMSSYANKISEFSVHRESLEPVFGGFEDRIHRSYVDNCRGNGTIKIPTGMDPFDYYTEGGIETAETGCMIMRSGVGKSRFLREVGVNAAMMGFPVLHIQAESTKKDCLAGYDATWTNCFISDIKRGDLPDGKMISLRRKIREVVEQKKSDVYVHAFEQFNTASMYDVYDVVRDIIRRHPIKLILLDYLECVDPANGIKYSPNDERHRRIAIANDFKNLCVEFDIGGWTCTQANDINPKLLNDPEFVITRSNVAECKSLVNPFSYYISGNQTPEEYDENIMRIFHDKLRHYKSNQLYMIMQDYDRGKFYDRTKSREYLDSSGIIDIFYKD